MKKYTEHMLRITLKAAAALNVVVRCVFRHCFVCTAEVLMYSICYHPHNIICEFSVWFSFCVITGPIVARVAVCFGCPLTRPASAFSSHRCRQEQVSSLC